MDINQDQTEFSLYIGTLLFKHADRQPLTEQEQKDLLEWKESTPQRQELFEKAMDRTALANQLRQINTSYDPEQAVKEVFARLGLPLPVVAGTEVLADSDAPADDTGLDGPPAETTITRRRITRRRIFRLSAAAAVIFLVIAGRLLLRKPSGSDTSTPAAVVKDIPPGGNKATLTLANGRTIVLDSAANGLLAQENDVQISKTAKGQLSYLPGTTATTAAVYNVLSTPKGGEYQLTLPDGTKVWLNAASSIRYPTAFTDKERRVEIKGEVFFDVAKNAAKPFLVMAGGVAVKVLGTKFDVMAYEDEEQQRTTLLDGKVEVRANESNTVMLAPGQQAILSTGGNTTKTRTGAPALTVINADTDKETAWMSGFFQFDHLDLPTIMRQFRRWYDIDVEYKADYQGRSFGGRISRHLQLSEALSLLESENVHVKIEGRKLIVLP